MNQAITKLNAKALRQLGDNKTKNEVRYQKRSGLFFAKTIIFVKNNL
jgi:hypothetical protein